jgi:lactoylglutathione lyase
MSDLFTLHHVSLYVRDADASASFYATVLGLQEIPNRVGQSNIRWFTIDGFRTLHLIGGESGPERPRPFSTHVALATRNFEAALARLEQHGVTYVSLARQPKDITIRADGVRQIYFQDPDGHWIEINDANGEP